MEETLTDINLFSIADEYHDYSITKKFSRREEGSKSGADWLWIIGEPGSWIPLLVQAKIVNPKTGNCQYMDYKNGEQRKRLLSYARQHAFIPVYCIYSFIPPDFVPPKCLNYVGRQKEDWACAFISPRAVRYLSCKGLKNQSDILKFSIPWMDPFDITSDKEPMRQAIASSLVNIRDSFETIDKMKKLKGTALVNRISWENLDALHAVRHELPRNICNLIKESLPVADSPLTGVSILSNIPIKQIKELR